MSEKLIFISELEELFTDVQSQGVFADQKKFTDCILKFEAAEILCKYRAEKQLTGFNLSDFLEANFIFPAKEEIEVGKGASSASEHCEILWDKLCISSTGEKSTLINLPHKFVVPGGRFNELFYWDSYFIMLGLQRSGKTELIKSMVDNFAYLIEEVGFIPNATRTYMLSRSQPPFFSLMIELLAQELGDEVYINYLPQLQKEYAFWMQGSEGVNNEHTICASCVLMPNGEILNRYWDRLNEPRPEGYLEDIEIYRNTIVENQPDIYRNIRAACASGWDFSGRWFEDPQDISTLKILDLIPVDLNALLWHLESTIAKAAKLAKAGMDAKEFSHKASKRLKAINEYLWNERHGAYLDYDFKSNTSSKIISIAMAFPLFLGIAGKAEAEKVLAHIEKDFLKPGGVLTTLLRTSQQWDSPNGWAPLQWIAFVAAQNYEAKDLAEKIASNWVQTVDRVFFKTGKIMEKYNVIDTELEAGGGEYPNQDGFGWTNGVYQKFKDELN